LHADAITAVPILGLSDHHHKEAARVAGAAGFLLLNQWLLIGTTVANLIGAE
jgi:hypothetical protein